MSLEGDLSSDSLWESSPYATRSFVCAISEFFIVTQAKLTTHFRRCARASESDGGRVQRGLKLRSMLLASVLHWLSIWSLVTSCTSVTQEDTVRTFFGNSNSAHTNNWAVLVCSSRYWFNYRVRGFHSDLMTPNS